jgi:2-polyprenyl-3-methyl-5-hydroxy-6-metoxy-1,4-benzoquinol methylase
MKEIFDDYVETSFDGREQATFKFAQFNNNYRTYFPVDKSKVVLDIGIGRGEMLSCMREWGHTYQGVDISPSTVRFCQALGLNCLVAEDTESWLTENQGKFSLVTCLDVLEHVPRSQTIGFLKALRASLSADGKAIIQVPNLQSPFGYLHHFNDFTHVSGFVEHSLAQVLLASGFKEMRFYGYEEIYKTGAKQMVQKVIRWVYHKAIRFLRAVNSNPNPAILNPVLYVVAR